MAVQLAQLVTFFLVLSRVSGLVLMAPVFSSGNMPMRFRGMIAVTLSLLITPLQPDQVASFTPSLLLLGPVFAGEVLLGLMLGLGLRLLMMGVQMTGQLIGHMSGMQLADVFDPSTGTSQPVFSQLLDMIMIAVFLAINGHRRVLAAMLDSFHYIPIGASHVNKSVIEQIEMLVTTSFHLGLQIGAPVMVALLMSTLILGFISRTLPQLNVIQIGFNLNSIVTLLVLMITIGAAVMLFEGQFDTTLQQLRDTMSLFQGTAEDA